MTQCAYRLWELPKGERSFDNLIEHRCQREGTEVFTYTEPEMIKVHGSTERLCPEHVIAQHEQEDLIKYLHSPKGRRDLSS